MEEKREKKELHPKNKHRNGYDLDGLIKSYPAFEQYVILNKFNNRSIDFANPDAVKALNKALLIHHYNIKGWDIPTNYLCPPIPGRVDYIHYLADLLDGKKGPEVRGLDIGTGANCIYPLLGHAEYGWLFTASDVNPKAIENAQKVVKNAGFHNSICIKQQQSTGAIFDGIIDKDDCYHFTMCNPPFHSSKKEANKDTLRKWRNLGKKQDKGTRPKLNFGGQNAELWCDGGEIGFVQQMILESRKYAKNCLWFTTLISKKDNLPKVYKTLKKAKATQVKTIDMAQGQKTSRIIAWSFILRT